MTDPKRIFFITPLTRLPVGARGIIMIDKTRLAGKWQEWTRTRNDNRVMFERTCTLCKNARFFYTGEMMMMDGGGGTPKGGWAAGPLIVARLEEEGSTETEHWSFGRELLSL